MISLSTRVWETLRSQGQVRRLDVLTAYVGRGAHRVLDRLGVERLRLVFGMRPDRPVLSEVQVRELEELRRFGKIRICSGLHAKVYLCDGCGVMLGSANFTRAGFGQLEEAVIWTDDRRTVRAAREHFDRIWKKSRPVPARIRLQTQRRAGGPVAEDVGRLGWASTRRSSPFDEYRPRLQPSTPSPRRVRLCAYPSRWLREGLETRTRVTWSTGRGARKDDVQVFAIFPEPGHPRLDAVHSLWRVVDGKLNWQGEWAPQTRFELLVRLARPVPKRDLVTAGLLRPPRWPQGRHGKWLRSSREVERVAEVLRARNRQQERDIERALGVGAQLL